MNLINNNPFRILSLPITASEREIVKQINTLTTYAEMGKTKTLEIDFPFLSPIDRSLEAIEEAKKQIEQSESKLLHSLFWFWKNNSVDELALEVLKEGNTTKSIEIWEKSVFANKNKVYKSIILNKNLIQESNDWSIVDDENHSLKKNKNEYIVNRKKETSSSIPVVHSNLNFDLNWTIEVDTEWLDGIDNNGYGIILGREAGNYYTFQISANGSYIFCKYENYVCNVLIPWKESDSINEWSENNLMIKKTEGILHLYINSDLVDTIEIPSFFGQKFGFHVTKNQEISFSDFRFCKLIESDSYGEGINISSKNFSCLKNLSTLHLSLSLASTKGTFKLNHFQKGIELARQFFLSNNIVEYSKLIAGDKYIYNSEKILHFFINDIVDSLKEYLDKPEGISINQLLNSFSSFPLEAKQFLNDRFVSKQIQSINTEIENAQIERKKTPASAIDIGKNLSANTKNDLSFLKKTLGDSDFQYQIIADKLSLAIIQCGIDGFNSCKDSKGEVDYSKAIKSEENYLNEYEYALNISVSERAKERAKENVDSCKKYIKDKEFYNCWFCGNNPPANESIFETTIYKETSRTYFPRGVKYNYLPVKIPRCKSCEKIHSDGSSALLFAFLICTVIGGVIGYFVDEHWIIGAIIGIVIGFIIGNSISDSQISKEKIKDTGTSTIRNYPVINQLINEGWQFSKPSA